MIGETWTMFTGDAGWADPEPDRDAEPIDGIVMIGSPGGNGYAGAVGKTG
jgi:hypothetical protein